MHDAVKTAVYVCLMPFCLPCLLVTYRRRSRRRTCVMISHDITLETEYSDLTRPAVRPLPSRKRALTICQEPQSPPWTTTTADSRPSTTDSPAQKTLSQDQSPLFAKLPAEIRLLIYAQVLGGETLHMRVRDRKMTHLKCRWPKASPQDCWDLEVYHEIFHGLALDNEHRHDGPSSRAGLLALPLTCRRVYTEALPHLYTHNTFDFDHADALANLSATLLPHRFHLLSHLSLLLDHPSSPHHPRPSWLRLWRLIAAMPALQTLRLTLLDRVAGGGSRARGWRMSKEREMALWQPLWGVRGLRVFEVRVPWEAGEGLELELELGGAPFVILRPERRGVVGKTARGDEGDSGAF